MENMTSLFSLDVFGAYSHIVVISFTVAILVLHVFFMICVWNDASERRLEERTTVVLSPLVWGLAALVFGLVAVAFYWLCHYSTFSRSDT